MFAFGARDGAPERARIGRYLAAARAAAVAVSGVMVVFGIQPLTGPLPRYAAFAMLVAYSLLAGALSFSAWAGGGRRLLALVIADLLFTTALVGTTGAFDSPYFALFLFAAAEVALYFEWRVGIAVIVSLNGLQVVITGVRLATSGSATSFSPLESRFLLLFVVGLLFVVLGENMRREERGRRAAERASVRVAKLNDVYAQLGRAHLRLEDVFDAVFSAAESVGGVLFTAILDRSVGDRDWRVAATSRGEMCPVGKSLSGSTLEEEASGDAERARTVEGRAVEALFPCMARVNCRQVVVCRMPAYSQTEEGILAVGRQECDRLDADESTFLRALAMQAQIAIHNAVLYRNRNEAFEQLAAFNEMQDTFFSAAAHELKTPLTVLGVLASTLEMTIPNPSPQQAEMFTAVEDNIHRLRAQTENMLAAARLEMGDIALHPKTIDPKLVARRALEAVGAALRDRGLTTDFEPNRPWGGAFADPHRLAEILENLLSNAAKFSPAKGHLTIRFERDELEARISVCNPGPPVSEDERERIFEKTYTGKEAGARAGTGLGLYVAKQLVLLHGGRIWVESSSGSTCFSFSLPNGRSRGELTDDNVDIENPRS